MKKILIVLATTFLLAVSFNAYSADDTYWGANLGLSTGEESGVDTGFLGSLFYGATYGEYRFEGEIFRQENDTDFGADIETMGFLINGYYDFDIDSEWTPYIGAGIGYGKAEIGSYDDNDFIWQVGAGMSYELNESTTLDFKYRYYSVEVGDGYDGHTGLVGIRFKF